MKRVLLMVGALALLGHCGDTPEATEIVVLVQADPAVRGRATAIRVFVQGRAGTAGRFDDAETIDLVPGDLNYQFSITPAGGDVGRQWRLQAEALDPGGIFVTQVISGEYLEGESRVVHIFLRGDCIPMACSEGQTCGPEGTCRPVGVRAGDLDVYEGGRVEPFAPRPRCMLPDDCDNDRFCDGVEQCIDGACMPGTPPCAEDVCNDDSDSCECTAEMRVDADMDGTFAPPCGNDCDDNEPYSATELNVLQNFVAGGGGLFIAGLGWSWPGTTATYPMSQAANLFGFTYTKDGISDPYHNINGAPKFYNFHPENTDTLHPHCPSPYFGTSITRGDNLRVLRMAVSTTGEFTQQNGGVNAISNLMQQWLSEINTIYGREYCVRFELIPNNNALVFPNPATDPWATLPPGSSACNNAGLILDRQATVIDSVVGAANYDISHVIAGSPFGGGCAGSLTTGVSGGFHLGVTRHEMGHQFGQSHVIDNGGNNNYEPKKPGGWTIQGGNDYGYAHAHSYHQLAHFLNSIPNVGLKIPTGNTIPTVDAGPDVYIPVSTPFTIKVAATDPDPNDSLTYVWDNMTRGPQQSIPVPDDSQGALFWRLLPDTASSRTFPMMSDVLANINVNNQEQLPSQARIMDIRVTVNDNHQMLYNGQMVNASGINSDDLQLTVAAAGPFEVTSQDVPGIVYPGGSDQTITWNVNGTDTLPINTQTVSIRLSTDGGYTYPIALVDSTPNTGLALVTLPNITSSSLRIKVAANNSIYFDVNTADFSLVKSNISIPESAADKEVRVYPNPARDFIVIDFPAQGDFSARLFNMNQRLISEHHNTYRLSTADLPHGIYLLELTDLQSSRKVYKKVMIRN